ncbi:MAG: tRNA dihydrouridine(20/20a) synthase DusA, partial [Pseudohongiellaceae bacterium]
FLRLLTKHALLYTEMITSAALVKGKAEHLLKHRTDEYPLAVQLGGSDPFELAQAAAMAERTGYQEINLNVGCPSYKVQTGRFGACLMAEPELVKQCVAAIVDHVSVPVSVKCRIGIDEMDSDEQLGNFLSQVGSAGCNTFIIHARIALLKGLSPRENREIPPLNYERVFRMKMHFPQFQIILNGGISDLSTARNVLQEVDGVMVGREAYQNPYFLSRIDTEFFGADPGSKTRTDVLLEYLPYIESEISSGTPLQHMSRHVLGLFRGESGGRRFRQHLSDHAHRKGSGTEVLLDAMAHLG